MGPPSTLPAGSLLECSLLSRVVGARGLGEEDAEGRAAVEEKAAVVVGFWGSEDEGGAVELNAGAAVGVIGVFMSSCSGNCGRSDDVVRVAMFVESWVVCRVRVELEVEVEVEVECTLLAAPWGLTVGVVSGTGAGGGG